MTSSPKIPFPTARRLSLSLLWLIPACAHGLSYVSVSDETLADRAEVIAEVRVFEVDPSPGVGRPVTDYLMAVERVIRGDAVAGPLTVRVPGGLLENGLGLHVYGAPSFAEGQRALLFLAARSDGTYRILHVALGAFRLERHGGQDLALRRLADAEEIAVPGRPVPQDGARHLERFRSWLEDRALGVHRAADYFVDVDADLISPPEKFTVLTGGGRKLRWDRFDSGGSASFRAHRDGQPGIPGGGFSQFQSALAAWTNDSSTPIRYNYGGTTSATGGLTNFDNVNAILFDDPNDNSSFDEPFNCSDGGTVAIGGPWFDPGDPHNHNGETFNTIVGGDIVTNKGIDCLHLGAPWFSQRKRAPEVFAHELGHTLGLGHSCGDDDSPSCSSSSTLDRALMRATIHSDNRGARLESDDRAGIRFLYGEPQMPPAAPSGLTATAFSNSRIDLAWNDNSDDETSFDVERRIGSGSFQRIATPGANTTSYQDTDVVSATTYSYRVRARNSDGASSFSNTASATTPGETAPADLSAFGVSDSKIRLFWIDNSSAEEGFQIEAKTGGGPFSVILSVPANATEATIGDLVPVTTYAFRVRAIGGAGDSSYSNEAISTTFFSDPEPCVAGPNALCLGGGRFQVEVTWTDYQGQSGPGTDVGLASTDSGLFYFFTANNWEMLVKLIDVCDQQGAPNFWVFAAATTDVAYELVVTDSVSGFSNSYTNDLGVAAPAFIDTSAFPTCFAEGAETPPPVAAPPPAARFESKGSCVPGDTRFCFNGGRYAVELEWDNGEGGGGFGQVDPLQSGDSGLFFYVDPENLEMLVKVLDGCAINDHVWVYAAAATSFEYTLRVTDTVTGNFKEYPNELGNPAETITDAGAFPCP